MQIGIGLPSTIPGVGGDVILEWARRAEAGPFSSLATIDRLVYPNFEPLITLAAAASVTRRIRLMTTILIGPLRSAGMLAKQAASLDALSGGRLTLGLGIGSREDDFWAAGVPFKGRGRRLEAQLELMKRAWAGEPVADDIGRIGPPPARPGGPELLIGGRVPEAIGRVGRWADGFIAGGVGGPTKAREGYTIAEESWAAAGRPGRPRFVAASYYTLGNAAERGRDFIRDYYAFLGPGTEPYAQSMPTSADAIKAMIQGFAEAGADEFLLWPAVPDVDQLDRLAELVG